MTQDQAAGPKALLPPPWDWRDGAALAGLVLLAVLLFRFHVLGIGTFVGDSDRLNSYLNLRTFEVRTLQEGASVAWNEYLFMGFGTYGLHYLLPRFDPTLYLEALFPISSLFRVAGYVSLVLLALAGVSAYLFVRDVSYDQFAAFVGSALYALSTFSLVRIAQVDTAYAILIVLPLCLLVLRKIRPGRSPAAVLLLALLLSAMLLGMFLQEVAYVFLVTGAYALFRGIGRRDWRPVVVFGGAALVATVIAAPRIVSILGEVQGLDRTTTMQMTCPCELLRWFDDGLFGRYPEEALSLQNGLNLREGLQIYTSTFAAFLVLIGMLRYRGVLGTFASLLFFAALGLVVGSLFDVRTGLLASGMAIGLLVANAVIVAVVRRRRPAFQRVLDEPDVIFFVLVLALVFAVVLNGTARSILHLAFARMDFTHSRIVIVALLPLVALVAIFLREIFGVDAQHETPRSFARHLAIFLAVAVGLLVLVHGLTALAVAVGLAAAMPPRLGTWVYFLPSRLVQLLVALGLFLVLLLVARLWALFTLSNTATALVIGLRRRATGASGSTGPWQLVGMVFGSVMVLHALAYTDFQMNGAQAWSYPVPFRLNGYFMAPGDRLRPPSWIGLQALAERLETDAYRVALAQDRRELKVIEPPFEPGYAAHLSQFWQLRLVEGYGAGVSQRLASLPWPDETRTLRSLSFSSREHLPWPLLAALNVKYAVVVNEALYYNTAIDEDGHRREARPSDLEILENPLPVAPRHFLAASAVPATPPAAQPPERPDVLRLTATVLGPTFVRLDWIGVPPEDRATTFQIEYTPASETVWRTVGIVGPGGRTHENRDLVAGTTYRFRVTPCRMGTCVQPGAETTVTTAVEGIVPPREVAAHATAPDSVRVEWPSAGPDAWYLIEQRAGETPAWEQIGETPVGVPAWDARGLTSLTPYRYRVRTCTPAGCSVHPPPSAVARAFTPTSGSAAELRGMLADDVTRESRVDGLAAPATFATDGSLDVQYAGDQILARVEPSQDERLLVLNEAYRPGWIARAGATELAIYPTNTVMRGIIVPPGVSEVELRYRPFVTTGTAWSIFGAGFALLAAGWLTLRFIEKRR
jgi:uncharacterized protein YhhL (DUF1145 family)